MPSFPLPIVEIFTNLGLAWFGPFLVYLTIGFAFGYVLEISGFGSSTKLAAQFYFKDLTVLKVMFTAIVVAMALIVSTSAIGLLDYNQVWVNPTYIWPGILGGLIMGVGFIVGGFCPGTSLVAAATLKLDGIFFVLGCLFGIFLFGETVQSIDLFWNSSYLGRLTIQDWLGLDAGVVAVGIVLMALFMFWGGEHLERIFGGRDLAKEPRLRYAGAAALLGVAVFAMLIGQPNAEDRWTSISFAREASLNAREVQIHPGELLATRQNRGLKLLMLDVRPEAEYNLFHLHEAINVPLENLPAYIRDLHMEQENTVIVLMSNDEAAATEAWKLMQAESVPNAYILEGGINNWLTLFAHDDPHIQPTPAPLEARPERLGYAFPAALGDNYSAANPNAEEYEFEYTPKIKLTAKRGAKGGGCG